MKETRLLAIIAVTVMTLCVGAVVVFESEETDAATYGSVDEPLPSVSLTANSALNGSTLYVYVGSIIHIQLSGNYDVALNDWFECDVNSSTRLATLVPIETGNYLLRVMEFISTGQPSLSINVTVVGPAFGSNSNPMTHFEMTALTFLNADADIAINDYGTAFSESDLQGILESYREFYVDSGTSVNLEQFYWEYDHNDPYFLEVNFTSVTSGFGLSARNDEITGTINRGGDITIGVEATANWGEWGISTVSDTFVIHSVTEMVTSVTIEGDTSGVAGGHIDLTASVSPSTADNTAVTWSITSGTQYASILSQDDDSCRINLNGAGEVIVRATADDESGVYDTHTITITEPQLVESISFRNNPTSVEIDDTFTVTATTSPSSAENRYVDWSVTRGENLIDWDTTDTSTGGTITITALAAGTVTIRADSNDGGASNTFTFTIEDPSTTYQITYHLQGGSFTSSQQNPQTYTGDETSHTFTLYGAGDLNYEGHEFQGWATNSSTSTVTYSGGISHTLYSNNPTLQLYAVWDELDTYTLRFDANGGSGAPGSMSEYDYGSGVSFTIPSTAPTWGEREFMGWAESSTATTAQYMVNTQYPATTQSSVLYAVWRTTYTISYDANEGTNAPAEQSWPTTAATYSFTTRDQGSMTREGYEFRGWGTSPYDTVATYEEGDPINLTRAENEVTLYAIWAKVFTLEFDMNGGTGGPGGMTYSSTTETRHTFTIPSQEPTRGTQYDFGGWCESADGEGTIYQPNGTIPVTDSTKLYAVWNEVITFTLEYSAEGATNVPTTQTHPSSTDSSWTFTISNARPDRGDDFEFAGWDSDNDGVADKQPGDPINVTGTTTLVAVWDTVYHHSLSYEVGDGTGSYESQTHDSTDETWEFTIDSTAPTPPSGYEFAGWDVDGNGTVDKQPGDTVEVSGPMTIYAVYSQITYDHELVYNTNGGSGGPGTVTENTTSVEYSFEVLDNFPTRDGYDCIGWADEPDAEVPDYVLGDHIPVTDTKTVYAVWREAVVHITSEQGDVVITTGNPFSYTVTTDIDGAVVSFVSEPPDSGWLSIDSSGRIYGTPSRTDTGSWVITVSATYQDYEAATQTFTITVNAMVHDSVPTAGMNIFITGTTDTNTPVQMDGYLDYGTFYAYSLDIQFSGIASDGIEWTLNGQPIATDRWSLTYNFQNTGEYELVQTVTNSYNGGSEDSLVVKFVIEGYPVVSFESNGGSAVASVTASGYKGTITLPADPTRDGYEFVGWFTDPELTQAFNRYTQLTQDITLYAAWTESTTSVTPGGDEGGDDDGGEGTDWTAYLFIVFIVLAVLFAIPAVVLKNYYLAIPAVISAVVAVVCYAVFGGL